MRTLTHKQRVLLNVVEELEKKGKASKFMLVKNLFLLAHEENIGRLIKFYNFLPYKYGPFSNVSYTDLNILKNEGYITENNTHLVLTKKGKQATGTANKMAFIKVKRVASRFNSDREIRKYVYKKYPEYTVKSEIVQPLKRKSNGGIFTIGYEGKDIDSFLDILIRNEIDILIDVRKNPFSMNFSFTGNKLKNYLEKIDVEYLHIPELGIEGKLRGNLVTSRDYQMLFKQYEATTLKEQNDQVERIMKSSEKKRVSLMCFEADIDHCHRGVIARNIEKQWSLEATHL